MRRYRHKLAPLLLNLLLLSSACLIHSKKPKESDLAGTYYVVKPGDTLSHIAIKYQVAISEIMDINGIDDERSLRVGQALFLPDPDPIGSKIQRLRKDPASKPVREKSRHQKEISPMFDFPVPGGIIVHKFSRTKKDPYDGIGIKAKRGSRILAPKNARVLFVGDDGTKFGLIIILEHQDPFLTVYAHLDQAFVKAGQQVQRGDFLGTVGSSGGIGFPHLHFQVRMGQRPQDPMLYLKRPGSREKNS